MGGSMELNTPVASPQRSRSGEGRPIGRGGCVRKRRRNLRFPTRHVVFRFALNAPPSPLRGFAA